MPKLAMILVLGLVVVPCAAMEVPFRDGSVIDVVNYTVTGSYVMLEMPGGGKVAYDVADIDLDTLRQAEAAAAAANAVPEPEAPPTTLGVTGATALAGPRPHHYHARAEGLTEEALVAIPNAPGPSVVPLEDR